ncbi:MAG: class I SAM-dependent methyltransferase [Halobacteriales archaeon]
MGPELAAVVPKARVEACLAYLEERGRRDETRHIEEYDAEHVAIPVTGPVTHRTIERLAPNAAADRRLRTLEDHLRVRGWSEGDLREAPATYARVGDIVVLDGWPARRPGEVGAALLDLHGDAQVVLAKLGIHGPHRRPRVAHVAGEARTRTVHREHGVAYALDLTEVMFSPGNQRERARMGEVVEPGERVVDLCAGIGYFALPMAAAGATVTAVERNPTAFRWLTSNASRNRLDDRLTAINADCRGCPVRAERAVVGHLPVHDCRGDATAFGGGYLDAAVRALDGRGHLHVHGLAYADDHGSAASSLVRRLRRREVDPTMLAVRRVKGVAPRTDHLAFDVRLTPTTASRSRGAD